MVKIFVYGTLKVGGFYADSFNGVRKEVKEAQVHGKIYGGAGYPRLILCEDSVVHGELHTYDRPDEVIKAMDRIEGYRGEGKSNLYNRKKVKVMTADGEEEAYIYEYAAGLEKDAEVIESGKWEI